VPEPTDTFPRQHARTQRFTLGEPRDLVVSPDGQRVVFARSRGGSDPVNCLWITDSGAAGDRDGEQLVIDPVELLSGDDEADLPADERARRERAREMAGGVTSFATDRAVTVAACALAGRLVVAGLITRNARELVVEGPVFDPRPDPLARRLAYVSGRQLRIAELDGSSRALATEPGDPETVSWGSADFVAAEEMGRQRGFWWSPDGSTIAACRVDVAEVPMWYIANAAAPEQSPAAVRYPAAGTSNPDVTLHLCPVDGSPPTEVVWDRRRLPYLAKVNWTEHGLTVMVQSRDQRDLEVLRVDPVTGTTSTIFADHDDDWVELVPGTGMLVGDDQLVMCADRGGARRLLVGDQVVSPDDVQVRSVISAVADCVVVTGNPLDDATVQHVYRWTPESFASVSDGAGVHSVAVGGDTVVLRAATLDEPGARWRLPNGEQLDRCAELPLVQPNVTLSLRRAGVHGDDASRDAVLLPHDHDGSPLPVLLDPYGGPHAQRVTRNHAMFLTSQWFADQGFAVLVADGRGTPGRGSRFERAVKHDLAAGVLDDQVAALDAAAERHPELDLSRVAIRGWSFGGYLAVLAVLRRPDVFHAAVAGAPVTEWRLYDTHYTERYLGDPGEQPDVYDANSLIPLAHSLSRPLLLIHGLADDNVVAAHTLQLSSALLAAGRPHEVLPLVGVTHMTPQEQVAENLLLHQLDFLRRSLGLSAPMPVQATRATTA
jgi:dipeptidyl-peptidase-4